MIDVYTVPIMTRLIRLTAPILILLCVLVTHASAEVWLGLQAAGSQSTISGSLPSGWKFKPLRTVAASAVIEIPITTDVHLSFQPGYSPRGATIAVSVSGEEEPRDSVEVTLDYFSVPILGRVIAGNGVGYIIGGLEVGFLLNAQWQPAGAPAVDITDSLRTVDVAANLGVGAMPRIYRSIRGIIELRYVQSLVNLAKQDGSTSFPRMKYSGWQFWLGAMIPVGRK
jgi:hypothetical protein